MADLPITKPLNPDALIGLNDLDGEIVVHDDLPGTREFTDIPREVLEAERFPSKLSISERATEVAKRVAAALFSEWAVPLIRKLQTEIRAVPIHMRKPLEEFIETLITLAMETRDPDFNDLITLHKPVLASHLVGKIYDYDYPTDSEDPIVGYSEYMFNRIMTIGYQYEHDPQIKALLDSVLKKLPE